MAYDREKRIKSLSRTIKLSIVVFVFWTLFVGFRTVGSYEILGYNLYRWDDDSLFINWLLIPAVLFTFIAAIKWAVGRGPSSHSGISAPSPELKAWLQKRERLQKMSASVRDQGGHVSLKPTDMDPKALAEPLRSEAIEYLRRHGQWSRE